MFRPEQDDLPVGSFDLDAMRFHRRVILERIMDDAPIEGTQRLEFNYIPPTPNFLRGCLRFLDDDRDSVRRYATPALKKEPKNEHCTKMITRLNQ